MLEKHAQILYIGVFTNFIYIYIGVFTNFIGVFTNFIYRCVVKPEHIFKFRMCAVTK